MAYVDISTFREYYRSELGASEDVLLQAALDTAESSINEHCQRSFNAATAPSMRAYVPTRRHVLRIHDFTSVTAVVENGVSLAATDYQAEPTPNVSLAGETVPYEEIRKLDSSWYADRGRATIAVTAAWGWPATPDAVIEATKILAKDLASSRNTAFGIAAITDFGPTRIRENGQVAKLLAPYRRYETLGIA